MGLLDNVLGGTPDRSGLSAATKALLLVLAAKAAKDYFARHNAQAPQGAGGPAPEAGGGLGGILGSVLGGAGAAGGLGGILGGAASSGGLGSVLGGGGLGGLLTGLGGAGVLGSLVDQFGAKGHADTVQSWVGPGANKTVTPEQLAEILGPGPLQELQQRTGMPQQALLEQLAQELPSAMDHITPDGRLPTDEELNAGAAARG